MEMFTPSNLIAGRIPVQSGNEREAVFHAAASLFDTEQLRFLVNIHDGYAWYLAAPANEFGSYPDAGSPLEAALPGAAGHQGNGAYIAAAGVSILMVVIKSDDGLKTYVGREKQVHRFIEMEGAPEVFYPPAGTQPWQSFLGVQRQRATRLLMRIIRFGLAANAACALAWFLISAYSGNKQHAADGAVQQQRVAMQQSIARLTALNVDDQVLREHARLEREVLRYPDGQITQFRFEAGKLTWSITMPASVPKERLASLGAGLKTEPLPDGRIAIAKGVN